MRAARRGALSRAILARGLGRDPEFAGYSVAKEALAAALNYKCVFCEFDLRPEGTPVEHFRPKAQVENVGEEPDKSRYWWLAWSWRNLLFACDRCNTWYKKNQFPLAKGSAVLAELSEDLDAEAPLLIDPCRIDPTEHIGFKEDATVGRWVAFPLKQSRLGLETIRVLGLDQDERLKAHVDDRVADLAEQVLDATGTGDAAFVSRTWQRVCRSLFAPRQPFHALTRDALAILVPEAVRTEFGLELPRLGTAGDEGGCQVFDDPAEFARLDRDLQLSVRALGDYAEWDEIRPVLVRLLAVGDWTNKALARVLGRSVGSVGRYRRQLGGE